MGMLERITEALRSLNIEFSPKLKKLKNLILQTNKEEHLPEILQFIDTTNISEKKLILYFLWLSNTECTEKSCLINSENKEIYQDSAQTYFLMLINTMLKDLKDNDNMKICALNVVITLNSPIISQYFTPFVKRLILSENELVRARVYMAISISKRHVPINENFYNVGLRDRSMLVRKATLLSLINDRSLILDHKPEQKKVDEESGELIQYTIGQEVIYDLVKNIQMVYLRSLSLQSLYLYRKTLWDTLMVNQDLKIYELILLLFKTINRTFEECYLISKILLWMYSEFKKDLDRV